MKRTQMFTRKMLVGCVTAACLMLGMNAFAQQGPSSGERNENGRPPAGGPPIERLDSNQDGTLSQEEFLAEFSRLDQNQDGKIEADEAPGKPPRGQQEGRSDAKGPQGKAEGRQGGRSGKGDERGERPQGPREGFTQHFDQNNDGAVSQVEFLKDFTRLDLNQNGMIEADELPQGPPQGVPPTEGAVTPLNRAE